MAWKSKTSSSQETNRFLLYSLQAMRIMMCKDERCGRVQWFLRKPVTQEVLIRAIYAAFRQTRPGRLRS
jgi:hypothetical protein